MSNADMFLFLVIREVELENPLVRKSKKKMTFMSRLRTKLKSEIENRKIKPCTSKSRNFYGIRGNNLEIYIKIVLNNQFGYKLRKL